MRRLACAAGALALTGCTVGPNFVPPKPPQVAGWHRLPPSDPAFATATDPDPHWWEALHDPVLTQLIGRAIAGNLDLQQAVLRVVESRQSVATARAAGLPTLSGTGSYMREQLGVKGILESKGVYGQLNSLADQDSPINQVSPGLGGKLSTAGGGLLGQLTQPIDLYQYGLDASWELDLFGRVRRSVEQARASAQAQQESANDSVVMLEAEVAQDYVQLRAAQALADSANQTVREDQAALDLTTRRQRQGLTTGLDVDQARTQLETDEQKLPGDEKQALQAIDQLDVLLGQAPGTLDALLAPASPLPALPGLVGIGVPSTLARRRPDIRSAEAQLHAATANVGVAVASFYPDISLTGNLGIRATDASYLTNWASHFYSAGPSLSLPIFQGGKLSAGLKMARAQQAEAALRYRGTVLNALREIEDGLVAYRTDLATRDRVAATLASAVDTDYLSNNRYRNGLGDFISVLDARRSVSAARQQLVQADAQLLVDIVTLYRALGGGWQDAGAAIRAPVIVAAPPPVPAALDAVVP
jgi:NodT family efflux transporter outer membrane factor (OMF) lipoprotein